MDREQQKLFRATLDAFKLPVLPVRYKRFDTVWPDRDPDNNPLPLAAAKGHAAALA